MFRKEGVQATRGNPQAGRWKKNFSDQVIMKEYMTQLRATNDPSSAGKGRFTICRGPVVDSVVPPLCMHAVGGLIDP